MTKAKTINVTTAAVMKEANEWLAISDDSSDMFSEVADLLEAVAADRDRLATQLAAALKRAEEAERERERDALRVAGEKREPNPEWEALADAHHAKTTAEVGIEPQATLTMLERWKADAEPANELGQVSFSRSMLDSATDALRVTLADLAAALATIAKLSADIGPCGCVDGCEQAPRSGPVFYGRLCAAYDAAHPSPPAEPMT